MSVVPLQNWHIVFPPPSHFLQGTILPRMALSAFAFCRSDFAADDEDEDKFDFPKPLARWTVTPTKNDIGTVCVVDNSIEQGVIFWVASFGPFLFCF